MKVSTSEPGVIVSGAVHAAMLAVTLIAFSDTRKFEDASESVPVEVITDQQFNQVMRGEKEAKPLEKPQVRADKQAEVEEKKPPTPKEAKVDTPVPPPPLKRIPDPGENDKPEPPEPPKRVAALPPAEPPKPEPPKPEPPKPVSRPADLPKAETPPEPPKRDAEAIEPPKRPQEPKKAEVAPTPPTPPKPPVRPRPAPNEAKPKPEEKPMDRAAIAKLLEKPEDAKPASRPRSGDETSTTKPRLDANAISQILSRDTPGARPSAAREASRTASLGAPTATGQRLSPSVEGQIVGFITDQYIKCWSPPPGYETHYMPQIRIAFNGDGSLKTRPELMNRQGDAKSSAMGESALRAVLNPLCNPMRLPSNLAPYFEQWIQSGPKILRFNPEDALG